MVKERLFYLDFIRALSMISIVIFHFNVSLSAHSVGIRSIFPDTYMNGNLGRIGVSLFFIISGAALMFAYQKELSLKTYFKKRVIAIFPMFWIAYAGVFMFYFYRYYTVNPFSPPVEKWTFILSIIGMDGYLVSIIPNYYLLGEWFLGCIIILYLLFPLLRFLMLKSPVLTAIGVMSVYFAVVQWYFLDFPIDINFLSRIPEFLFGMYFVRYIKTVNVYTFAAALLISVLSFILPVNIHEMYKITIIGIALFLVIVFIGQHIKMKRVQSVFSVISKYSFGIFLVHHVTMEQVVDRFTGKAISTVETYVLFLITCIIISLLSVGLFKLNSRLMLKRR